MNEHELLCKDPDCPLCLDIHDAVDEEDARWEAEVDRRYDEWKDAQP